MKRYFLWITVLIACILILPAATVFMFTGHHSASSAPAFSKHAAVSLKEKSSPVHPPFSVSVYRSKTQNVQHVPLEQYVIGVVASEMPADFDIEALKAQALAARTYIFHYLLTSPGLNIPDGADVTDTNMNQVYKDDQQLKKEWGHDYSWKLEKVTKAVRATEGEIITYKDQPITASFFSTSNGYTEDSADYWGNDIPYLQSVPSPWDRHSPKFLSTETIPVQTVDDKLGVHVSGGQIGDVLQTTPGHRVGSIEIDGKTFTGREIRQQLDLRSTDFFMKRAGDRVSITTKGWGHGVGMSQYGANGMAKEGRSAGEIVQHYYQGVSISKIKPFIVKLTAKK